MTVTSEHTHDEWVIHVDGHFGFDDYRAFRAAYPVGTGGEYRYRLDFHALHSLDSAAIGMLLLFGEQVGGCERVEISNPTPEVRRFLHLAGMDKRFRIPGE